MRALVLIFGGWALLYGQNCVPGSILPGAQVSGTLSSSSCVLSDGTPYTPYRLTLPVRGQLQLNLTPADGTAALVLRDGTGAQVAIGTAIQQEAEAGTYTVLLNGASPGQAGQYQFQPTFTAEPGMLCTVFPNLGIGQTVAGSLGSSGCTSPDSTPYEAYQVNTFGSGNLSVSVSSSNLNPQVTVRDDSGNTVASATNTVTAPVAAGSQYQVVVSLLDNPGPYQLATSFQPAPTETCVPQKSFTAPGQDNGAITPSSCAMVIDDNGDVQYYNYYLLAVPSTGLLEVSASSSDFQPTLALLDGAGNQLALDSGGAGNGDSDIRMQVPAGNYVVQLSSNLAAGGNYGFTYSFTPGAPQPCPPAALSLSPTTAGGPIAPVSGTLSAASCRTNLGLADLYSVTLPSAGMLSFNLSAPFFTSQVAIRDAKDNLVALNEDVEGLGVSSVSALLPAGSYTIVAAAASGSGAYQLSPAFTAQAVPPCAQMQQLTVNSGYVQSLGASGCFNANGQPADLYQFTLASDSLVAAIMTSTDVAGFLKLTDANGNVLRSDADSYSYNDPMIVQFLKAGTYQLQARAATAGSSGLYQMTLLGTAGVRPPFCAPLAALTAGSTVAGTITYGSCQYTDNTFADVYPLTLAAPASVDLQLTTSAFDPYLVLLDGKGNIVAQGNDGGGTSTAEIAQALAAGSYFLVVKPFNDNYPSSDYTAVGAYQLTFGQQ
jgi:hypothetical protein